MKQSEKLTQVIQYGSIRIANDQEKKEYYVNNENENCCMVYTWEPYGDGASLTIEADSVDEFVKKVYKILF